MVEVVDDPPLIDAAMLELTRWMAGYYACAWGQALDAVVPAGVKKQAGTRVGTFLVVPEEIRRGWLDGSLELRRSRPRSSRSLAGSDEPLTVADVCRMAKCARADRRAAQAGPDPRRQAAARAPQPPRTTARGRPRRPPPD